MEKTILVIDDNTDIRENTAEILELAGYKTFTAKVEIKQPGYSVVNVSDMQLHTENAMAASEAEAYYLHDTFIKQNPSLKNQIQVVSQFELN
jgi:CheY-like chemotaxis protein